MKNPVHVACAMNATYVMPLCVMLASLVEKFDRQRDLHIHIVCGDATEEIKENIWQSIRMNYPSEERIKISWYSLNSTLTDLPLLPGDHVTTDAYARLLFSSLLPESCEHVVYLDCDLVVLTDISALYDSTFGGEHLLGAAVDMSIPTVSHVGGILDYAERGISPDQPYFNSGVMTMNLKLWRERNPTPAMLEFARNYPDGFMYHDQGLLNAFLHDDWTPLDLAWNQQLQILFEVTALPSCHTHKEWSRVRDNALIVHFAGKHKPWYAGKYGPRYSYFFRSFQKTVFKGSVPHRLHLEDVLGFPAYYQVWSTLRKLAPGLFAPDLIPPKRMPALEKTSRQIPATSLNT